MAAAFSPILVLSIVSGATFEEDGVAITTNSTATISGTTFADDLGVAVVFSLGFTPADLPAQQDEINGCAFEDNKAACLSVVPSSAYTGGGTVIISGTSFYGNSGGIMNIQAGDVSLAADNIYTNLVSTTYVVAYTPPPGLQSSLNVVNTEIDKNVITSSFNGATPGSALFATLAGGNCSFSVAECDVSDNVGAYGIYLSGDNTVTASVSTTDIIGNGQIGLLATQMVMSMDSNILAGNGEGDAELTATASSAYNVIQDPIVDAGLTASYNYIGVNPEMTALQAAPAGSSFPYEQFPQNQAILVGANPALLGGTTLNGIVRTTADNPCGPFAPASNSGGGDGGGGTVPITIVDSGSRPVTIGWYRSRKTGRIRDLLVGRPHGKLNETSKIAVKVLRRCAMTVGGQQSCSPLVRSWSSRKTPTDGSTTRSKSPSCRSSALRSNCHPE